MGDISVLGLGQMGSALARSLVSAGHRVTVWNRSPAKAQRLVDLGADGVAGVAAAVDASPVVLVCIDNYRTTRAIFDSADVIGKLPDRVIVQLSTGTPREARDSEAWFVAGGVQYLDGAILVYPEEIGTPAATLVYAGHRPAFDRCEPLLRSLGGDSRFVGEDAGSAAALDMAWLSALLGTYAGTAQGAVICESEGVDLDLYVALFEADAQARWIAGTVAENAYANPGATLSVWNDALQRIKDHADDAKISRDVPDFVGGILDRAVAAGHGDEHIAAMVKVLRQPR